MLSFADNINQEQKKLLTFLEQKLSTTIEAIYEIPAKNNINLKEIEQQIKEIKEEIKCASERDMPALFYQLNLQHNLAKRMAQKVILPDSESPFFAYMCLRDSEGREKDYFLGHVSFISAQYKIRILDWKQAPLAQVFYQYQEEEEFYLELEQGDIEGTLLRKALLTVQQGVLKRVEWQGKLLLKQNGEWGLKETNTIMFRGGEGQAIRHLELGTGQSGFRPDNLLGLLDAAQYELIRRPSDRPLLIIGGAGSGKTTVALHRLAVLADTQHLSPSQMMVIVPHQGLIRLAQKLLSSIGQEKIKIKTADDWFLAQCQRILPTIHYKISPNTPAFSTLVKRHRSMRDVLQKYAQGYLERVKEQLKKLGILDGQDAINMQELFSMVLSGGHLERLQQMRVKELKQEAEDILFHLHSVLSNHVLMSELEGLSGGVVNNLAISETLKRTAKQIELRLLESEELSELQRFELQEIGYLDHEDAVLLLALTKYIWGSVSLQGRKLSTYKHLVLDEAQELAAVELNILGESLKSFAHTSGEVTVAGDSVQQIDPAISFTSWENLLEELGVDIVAPEELTISYRSPQSIIDLAYSVLGPLAPAEKPQAKEPGVAVKISAVEHLAQASLILYSALEQLFYRETNASVAIICSSLDSAKMLYSQLKELQNVRLIEDSEFSFRPGIDITTVEQVRGLEFDYVIIPDANIYAYPNSYTARKRLHLAITRAIHQLWILYYQQKSPLIDDRFLN